MTRSIRLKPRLKEAREHKSLSQAALGRAVASRGLEGFRANHIGLLELGYRDATWAEVEALADVLKVDPYWLADRPKPAPAVAIGAGLAKAKEEAPSPALSVAAGVASAVATNGSASEAPVADSPAKNGTGTAPSRLPAGDLPIRNGSTEAAYRAELGQLLSKANQTLLDRSLAPAEWRAWRDYAEKIKATLRTL